MFAVGFWILTVLALGSAIVVVTRRSAVISALALAFNLVSIAGFFFLLDAQFIGFLQIIVYAGAIMVLILFVLMLLNLKDEARLTSSGPLQRWLGPLLALALGGLLTFGFAGSPGSFPPRSEGFGTVAAVGQGLFTRFFYPFEAISLLLVVAMIGAVLLAKKRL
jgi:NADH-quinone oxidoreductase subunit J